MSLLKNRIKIMKKNNYLSQQLKNKKEIRMILNRV